MNLKDFVNELSAKEQQAFADSVGLKLAYLKRRMYPKDGLFFSPKICVLIEQNSNHKVTRQELRPDDWEEIWPELKMTNQAA